MAGIRTYRKPSHAVRHCLIACWGFLLAPALLGQAFEARAFNLLREGANTFLYLELSPTLFGIGESGFLEADLEFHFSFSRHAQGSPYLERRFHKVIRHDFFSGSDPFFQEFPFELPPGPYQVSIEVKDRKQRRDHYFSFPYESRALNQSVTLSDILLIQEVEGIPVPRPLITEDLAGVPNRLRFRVEVYSPEARLLTARAILYREDAAPPGPDDREEWQVRQYTSQLQLNEVLTLEAGRAVFSDAIDLFELPRGDYLLELFLYDEDSLIAEQNSRFHLPWNRLKEVFLDLNRSIEQMAYVCPAEELARIKSPEDMEEKLRRFQAFWEARNEPGGLSRTEALESYYGRIFHAEEFFGEGNTPGWKTLRGKTHVLYGPPENQMQQSWKGRVYELWDYPGRNLRFVFVQEGERWVLQGK